MRKCAHVKEITYSEHINIKPESSEGMHRLYCFKDAVDHKHSNIIHFFRIDNLNTVK